MRPPITTEAEAMIRWAQGFLKGFDGKSHGTTEALDWLLRDACEYGSPTVGAQARKTWPDSPETQNWHRLYGDDFGSFEQP